MQVALGRSDSDEIRPGLHKISKVSAIYPFEWNFFLDMSFLLLSHVWIEMSCLYSLFAAIRVFALLTYQRRRSKGKTQIQLCILETKLYML